MTDPSIVRGRVLVLCTRDSARGRMAERLLRELGFEDPSAAPAEGPAGSAA